MFAQWNANITTMNGTMAAASDSNHHSRHPDFSSDQAAALRDIARNGSGDDGSLYGFHEMGSSGHANGLSHGFQGLDDPAALLESLAAFDHLPSSNETATSSTDHFASLLQAAATATGEEAAYHEYDQGRNDESHSHTPEQFAPSHNLSGPEASRKRKQDERDEQNSFVANKTARRSSSVEEAEQLAREREIWGPEVDELGLEESFESQYAPIPGADARAVGVHSAAALFRRPTSASKKYTRAPMAKIFTSLELTPEQFLHLQAAAKTYMLNENYPERSQSVGTRSRGDTDMIKLKLFECVRCFLDDEGWGERCFGESAPGAENRKLRWPLMQNKIISLVTPLMRRMVTNERQRLYALETRKNAAAAKQARSQTSGGSATPIADTPQAGSEADAVSTPPALEIDPKLNQYHYSSESPAPQTEQPDVGASPTVLENNAAEEEDLMYHVSIMQGSRRVVPRFTLTPNTCPTFSSLAEHINATLNDDDRQIAAIQVMGPGGLVSANDESSWAEAIEKVKHTAWLDKEARCVVQVE